MARSEVTCILRAIERAGGCAKKGGSGHWKIYSEKRLVTVISSTISQSARGRILADLKRGGLPVTLGRKTI